MEPIRQVSVCLRERVLSLLVVHPPLACVSVSVLFCRSVVGVFGAGAYIDTPLVGFCSRGAVG